MQYQNTIINSSVRNQIFPHQKSKKQNKQTKIPQTTIQTAMLMELIHEEFMVLKQAVLYDPCPETTNTISSNTSSLILTESRQELNLQLPEG